MALPLGLLASPEALGLIVKGLTHGIEYITAANDDDLAAAKARLDEARSHYASARAGWDAAGE